MSTNLSRREMIKTAALAAAGAAAFGISSRPATAADPTPVQPNAGRITQGVSMGPPSGMSFEQYLQECAKIGFKGVDLVGADKFTVLKKYGMMATMIPSHSLPVGLSHKENHDGCLAKIRASIEVASAAGFPNVICFSGNRNGMADDEGAKNCVEALKKIAGFAEEKNVTLCMELLNSKVNHKDYMCDRTAWGVEVMKAVGSPRCKLLYDIYHMQVQEGDVIATIRQHIQYIGHFHTAGVPGRKDIDESQELYYPAIMRAIADTGYKGFVCHEFSPKGDKMKALVKAYNICNV